MRQTFRFIKSLGDLFGAILVIATFIAVCLHVLHGLGAPLPEILPMLSVSN